MVNFSDYAGSFLKGTDLQGREHLVTIEKIVEEEVGDSDKLVAHFVGRRKTLPLNKGHIAVLSQAFGEDPANCIGRQVILYPEATRTPQGAAAVGVRLKLPQQSQAAAPPPQQTYAPPPPESPPPAAGRGPRGRDSLLTTFRTTAASPAAAVRTSGADQHDLR